MRAGIDTGPTAPGLRFPSKRDLWIELLLWSAVVSLLVAVGLVMRDPTVGRWPRIGTIAVCLAGAGFSLWVLYGTSYGFGSGTLDIHSGPFRWRIPLGSIDQVIPSRNPLSSPALSLDRLEVRLRGRRRSILISPADKAAFLRALLARAPQLELRGDEAARREDGR